MVYHALRRRFSDVAVVFEERPSRSALLRRRAVVLGPVRALGQLMFTVLAQPVLNATARSRVAEIRREFGLCDDPIAEPVVNVPSVNSDEAREALRGLAPRVIVVSGARIIGRKTLAAVPAPFVNMHAGITPLYRGVHGGYWALREQRPELVGTTIHRVDEGIDTGRVLGRAVFSVTERDSFVTYPYLHLAAGLPVLVETVAALLDGAEPQAEPLADLPSQLRTHPTLWDFVRGWVRQGVR
jgi:methionyl-tRNA formyltransferase